MINRFFNILQLIKKHSLSKNRFIAEAYFFIYIDITTDPDGDGIPNLLGG